MALFNVLIEYHPMLGVDMHDELAPAVPVPVPVPMAPHVTGALLNWVIPASMAETVRATSAGGRVMKRGTDIQIMIPHVPTTPACLLAVVLTAFSGSKSHFGPRSVQVRGGPVAVALIPVGINLNLNCAQIPLPTGAVIAPNSVVTGMTWGDIIGGFASMFVDAALQAITNAILPSGLGPSIAGAFIGSPVGFSFNANGGGPIGFLGRAEGDLSDWARGVGESLGGDTKEGEADRDAAIKKLGEDVSGSNNPFGWNIYSSEPGKEGDVQRLTPPIVPALVHSLDNPAAEAF